MTHEELNKREMWECLKPGGFYEVLIIKVGMVYDAGFLYKNLIGTTTEYARQKIRDDGWEINVHTYNKEGAGIPSCR